MEEQKLIKRKRKAQKDGSQTLLLSACADLAELYIKEGRHHLAIEEYKIIADIYKSENKLIEYAQANRGIGEAYMGLHDFEKALEYQNLYFDVANDQKNKVEQQRALATIGHIYLTWYLETQTDPEKNLNAAYKYFMKSLIIAEGLVGINKLERVDMLARLFSNLGLVKECLGDYDKALELINRSIAISKQHDIYEQLSRGYMSMASLSEKKREYNNAIHCYNLAIDAANKIRGNVDLMCAALLAKSETLIKLDDFHSAKQTLLKAYKLKTPNIQDRHTIERNLRVVTSMCYTEDKLIVTCDDQKELKKLYEKMGDGACELKNYAKAIEYYKLMLECAEKSGVGGRDLASCYYSLAETYKDNCQFNEAVSYFEKEYALCVNLQDNLNTLSKIADTKEAGGAPVEEVREVYERAFKNCRSNNNLKEERRMISRCIAYLKRNNYHTEAFKLNQILETLDHTNFEDESSSSDNESEDSEAKGIIGNDINLDEITDDSDDSNIENHQSTSKEASVVGKRRTRNFVIKKNAKGESQLHVACINGSMPVVRHLIEQGHPVNIRDNSGWLPLHEACNHGHLDIVTYLLEKGAAINDRGGTHCNGITPLYDAANNGHLKIVELLLDRGALATVKTDDGDTPLNILKEWQANHPLYADELTLYQSLVRRMTEALEKAGQSSKPKISVNTSPRTGKTRSENVSISPHRDRYLRALDFEDNDSEDFGGSSSSPMSDSHGATEYVKVMETLRNKVNNVSNVATRSLQSVAKRSALISADKDNTDDWLEEDIPNVKAAKKRKMNPVASLLSPTMRSTNIRPGSSQKKSPRQSPSKIRLSEDLEIASSFIDDDFEEECMIVENRTSPLREERRTSNESRSSITGVKRKSQASLLDAGFSRTRSTTPDNSFPGTSRKRSTSGSPLRRTGSFENRNKPQQQKLTSFGHTRSFAEADSTTVVCTQARAAAVPEQIMPSLTPNVGDLMVYVDVKIEEKVFRIPVLLSQVQTNTIGWLAKQAANKYSRKECTIPTLELETMSGALLSDEDPLSLLFPLGSTQAEPIVGRVVKLSLPPLVDRYKETCRHMDTDADSLLCNKLEEMSIMLNLADGGFLGKSLVPLCKALNHQASLIELDLSGNFLDADCVAKLCASLPTLINLATLNLRCTGLVPSHLTEFVKVFTSSSTPVLQSLTSLDLSDNFLRDVSLSHLSQITRHLRLTNLNLSNVRFTENIFKEGNNANVSLNLTEIQYLDVSDNDLGAGNIKRFVSWTTASKLVSLNVSRNCAGNQGILGDLLEILKEDGCSPDLKNLDLSRCNIQENELYEFLRLCPRNLLNINLSYNSNLTGISLRRLLEYPYLQNINLIGCKDILRYFDDYGGCNLFQASVENGEKVLKISSDLQNHPGQVASLIDMFRNKYCDCYLEKADNFLLLSSKMPDKS